VENARKDSRKASFPVQIIVMALIMTGITSRLAGQVITKETAVQREPQNSLRVHHSKRPPSAHKYLCFRAMEETLLRLWIMAARC
jgi:hypothetical protein